MTRLDAIPTPHEGRFGGASLDAACLCMKFERDFSTTVCAGLNKHRQSRPLNLVHGVED